MKNKTTLEKAEEVKITTSMQTFLRTFFNMWEEDAQELAVVLGYDPQEWYWDMIGEDTTVEIMKSAVEAPKENKVHKNTYENLKKARIEYGKLNRNYEKEKEVTMAKEEKTDLQKSIDEAVQAALKKAKEENAELLKAKDEELAELKKEKIQKERDEMTELCKGYSFVEDAVVLSDALMLCKSVKGFDVILDTLEKARVAIKASLEKEHGTDEEADLNKDTSDIIKKSQDKTKELLKARKEGK
jgi:hypothetical protein